MSVPHEIGKNIRKMRIQKGISQEYLALYSDVSVSHLRNIEHGEANPTVKILERLAKTLEVSYNAIALVEEEGDGIG